MLNGFERTVALRYLSSKRRDGFISFTAILSSVAIALGVTALIVVMSVMNGFRIELMDKILGYHGHVLVQGYGGKLHDYNAIDDILKDNKSVIRTLPFVESQVMVTNNGRAWGAIARGFAPEYLTQEKIGIKAVRQGDLKTAAEADGLVLGYELANRIGVQVGDVVTIVSPNMTTTPFGSTLRYKPYPVAAIVEIGVYQFDESFIGMRLDLAQRFFSMGDSVSTIEVFVDDPDQVEYITPGIQEKVGDNAYVSHWKSYNSAIVGALQTERVVMFLVVMLIIVVAVFNIASSLFMLVKDKSSDIAILRTIGASRNSILKIFITVGLAVGLLGITMGSAFAALIISNLQQIKSGVERLLGLDLWDPSIRFVTEMKAVVVWEEVGLVVGAAVLLSFLATIPPARRAAKLDPVEVLRHE